MSEAASPVVEQVAAGRLSEVRPLLLDLLREDQRHYGAPGADAASLSTLVGEVQSHFEGENLVLGIRDGGHLVAFCWCVFFDPGTGYEAEVAEVFVRPDHRGRGLATTLVGAAVDLFRERSVTFASVWTHPSNAAAVRLYAGAGFAPTEQTVLTWLPDAR
ncbi:MAG TPA: GNAT family N-acetyltransferase [Candidatus Dormibacteraeota bacterium]